MCSILFFHIIWNTINNIKLIFLDIRCSDSTIRPKLPNKTIGGKQDPAKPCWRWKRHPPPWYGHRTLSFAWGLQKIWQFLWQVWCLRHRLHRGDGIGLRRSQCPLPILKPNDDINATENHEMSERGGNKLNYFCLLLKSSINLIDCKHDCKLLPYTPNVARFQQWIKSHNVRIQNTNNTF